MSNIANQSQAPVYSAGSVTVAGSAITVHKTTGRVTAARSSAGVFTLTTQDELPGGESLLFIQEVGATGSTPEVDDTSNTVKTIRTFAADGTTATDKSFKYIFFTLPVAQ